MIKEYDKFMGGVDCLELVDQGEKIKVDQGGILAWIAWRVYRV